MYLLMQFILLTVFSHNHAAMKRKIPFREKTYNLHLKKNANGSF